MKYLFALLIGACLYAWACFWVWGLTLTQQMLGGGWFGPAQSFSVGLWTCATLLILKRKDSYSAGRSFFLRVLVAECVGVISVFQIALLQWWYFTGELVWPGAHAFVVANLPGFASPLTTILIIEWFFGTASTTLRASNWRR